MNNMKNKKELRRHLLEVRSRLSSAYKKECSDIICRKVTGHPAYKQAKTVMFYMPVRGEADVLPALKEALSSGKRVILPKTEKEKKSIRCFRIRGLKDLTEGAYGILEPDASLCQEIVVQEVELVIVPGVGFDVSGFRLGYGGGYYDRFLSRHPGAVRMGVAYDEQIVNDVKPEPHDCRMDWLVSPRKILEFTRLKIK
jgi:5-formyltetrahydrofolate cyclo-ligase